MSNNFDPNQNHYVYIKKDTTPLIFIHGVGLDHQMWDKQVKYFSEFFNYLTLHSDSNCDKRAN